MTTQQKKSPLIGIIGGVGPYAGLDFLRKIFDNTLAQKDQDYLDCVLVSCPSVIPDRTGFLLGNESQNPAEGLFQSAVKLSAAEVQFAVVACNTAHAGKIFTPFCDKVRQSIPNLSIINMLEACASFVQEKGGIRRIGLLATKGTHQSKVYHEYFGSTGNICNASLLEPDDEGKENVHAAIYSTDFGIKAFSSSVKPEARKLLTIEIDKLISRGAEAIILGCTELPLAIQAAEVSVPVIDPGLIAARALIARAAAEKLLPC